MHDTKRAFEYEKLMKEEIKKTQLQKRPIVKPSVSLTKVGRNSPCPCGSGKKYKKCCGAN